MPKSGKSAHHESHGPLAKMRVVAVVRATSFSLTSTHIKLPPQPGERVMEPSPLLAP